MALLDLPIEIVTHIVECLEEVRDLNSFVRVSHLCYDIFNDLLYRNNIRSGSSAMFWAAENGEESTIRLLIHLGVNINTLQRFHHRSSLADVSLCWTALHIAARRFRIGIVKILIEAGADLEVKNHRGWTPLFVENNSQEYEQYTLPVVRLLLEAGANPEARDPQRLTPLFHALLAGHEQTARQIALTLGPKLSDSVLDARDGLKAIHVASRFGLTGSVQFFVDQGAHVDVRDARERTALHHILLARVQQGYGLGLSGIRVPGPDESIDTVLLLLNLGADPALAIPSATMMPYSARQIGLLSKDGRIRELFPRTSYR